jgi:hypothetical protein
VEVNGDMAEYWQRWEEGRWWWWMDGSGGLTPVGEGRITKMRCPKKGAAADGRDGGGSSSPQQRVRDPPEDNS